jgi:hypothetical protein
VFGQAAAGLPGEPATMGAQARLTGRQMIRLCAPPHRINSTIPDPLRTAAMRASTPASAYYGVRSDSKPSGAPIAVTAPARQAAEPLLSQVPG